ncbi:LuxR family transcriptional regulator [Streptomyces bungoensis]|uniref:LuxR family transcriptional regulator n=1 Tax=Streptomyces bungoensis TaxID=285568 RepID=A0A124I216_9ACTN|nr:LuxR C-terminal-related transcriptional regulator [Streptomyces bungoensis]KUN79065.1 LuxR family transcriptional regulator [Streptomyces bungoensis]
MASLDPGLTIEAANADFFRHVARPSTEICGRSIYDVLHPSARNVLAKHFTHLSTGRCSRFVERVVAMRGHDRVFSAEMTGIAVKGEGDDLSGVVVLMSPDDEPAEAQRPAPAPLLTALDARILEGVATGASTVQLASRLYLSRQGVEYHVGLMLRRFKAPNRAALVSRAYSTGVLTVGAWPPRAVPDFIK